MSVPNMSRALRGWVKPTLIKKIEKMTVDFRVVETEIDFNVMLNKQPSPEKTIDRNLQGNRAWKWWSLIIQDTILLNVDDIIVINNIEYRILNITDWSESGFTKYTAIEDFT